MTGVPGPKPKLKAAASASLQAVLEELTQSVPCAYLSIATPEGILWSGQAGPFDPMDKTGRQVTGDETMWFASTTKLLTAVCYLQLVDRGILSLDTAMSDLFPPLAAASKRILKGFEGNGQPIFEDNDKPITLKMLLNQTSGFGMEFGEVVPRWKRATEKGKGFVNSCKVENLIHTPIVYEPGTVYEYGNSAEWLGLMLPSIVDQPLETYLQENVLKPLGLRYTTFYPFDHELKNNLLPTRYGKGAEDAADVQWEELNGQMDLLTLPRARADIEYPVAGGGIYSRPTDYVTLLQNLLGHFLSLSTDAPAPNVRLLSDQSVASLFSGTLPSSAKDGLLKMYNPYLGISDPSSLLGTDDVDWSTAMAVYRPNGGARRGGWGRRAKSVGWGGAAGTEYWMDPETGIAVVFTTQMLPGNCARVKEAKQAVEKAVYDALE